jgi:uncharacterized protein YhfF
MPAVGEVSIVLDGSSRPTCAIVTTSVEVKRFDEVDAEFAFVEGQGGGSYKHWRLAHEAYFKRQGHFSPSMLVVCERFELLEVF